MDNLARSFLIDFGILSLAILAGVFIRAKIQVFQKLFLPVGIIAGVLLLTLNMTGFINYSSERFTLYVVLLLMTSFAALGFRKDEGGGNTYSVVTTSGIMGGVYILQALLGILLVFLWIRLFPSLSSFPANFGFNLFLGFGGDYSTALNVGARWEQFGLFRGGYTGAVFGLIGIIWAYVVGIIMVNWGIRKKKLSIKADIENPVCLRGIVLPEEESGEAGRQTTHSQSLDSLALHVALLGGIVFLAFVFMEILINRISLYGPELAGVLWNFAFVPAAILGVLARRFIVWMGIGYIVNEELLTRTNNLLFDYMIAASLASVPLILLPFILKLAWAEIIILTSLGGLVTLLSVFLLTKYTAKDYSFERALPLFGYLTGNAVSGVALLRIVDPEMKSPAAMTFVYATSLSLFIWVPLIALGDYVLIYSIAGQSAKALTTSMAIMGTILFLIIGAIIIRLLFVKKTNGKRNKAGEQNVEQVK